MDVPETLEHDSRLTGFIQHTQAQAMISGIDVLQVISAVARLLVELLRPLESLDLWTRSGTEELLGSRELLW